MPPERLVPVGERTFMMTGEQHHRKTIDFVWHNNDGDPHPRFLRSGRLFDRVS